MSQHEPSKLSHRCRNKTMQKPDSIILIDSSILDGVVSYDAYVYEYTNVRNGKKYVGYHKGQFDGSYWHSSKNKEFIEVFSGMIEALTLKIINYGSKEDMMNLEHEILKENDAVNNDKYYNGSNAATAYRKGIRPDICQDALSVILELDITLEDKNELLKISRGQVRYVGELPSHVLEIRQRVKDKGDIAKTEPITIFEGANDGNDLIGDGNHTLRAIEPLGNVPKAKVRRVTKEIIEAYSLTRNEMEYIGNLLNKKPETIKLAVSKEDAVKIVLAEHEDNQIVINSDYTKSLLAPLGFTKDQQKSIIQKAKKQAADKAFSIRGLKIANYTKKTHPDNHKKVVDRCQELTTSQSICVSGCSGNVKTILQSVIEQLGTPAAKNRYILNLLIYHNSEENEEKWNNKNQSYITKTINNFLKITEPVKLGKGANEKSIQRKLSIHLMDHLVPDVE